MSARMRRMEPHERATGVWYRVAGLVSREQRDLAVEIIEAEIRSAQHEVLLDAARLVLSDEPSVIATLCLLAWAATASADPRGGR